MCVCVSILTYVCHTFGAPKCTIVVHSRSIMHFVQTLEAREDMVVIHKVISAKTSILKSS